MIRFPAISEVPPLEVRKMTLREYAEFSEECLKNNPAITPENCLYVRDDERTMPRFCLPPDRH